MTVKKTAKNNSCKQFFSDRKDKPKLKEDSVKVPEFGGKEFFFKEPTAGEMTRTRKEIISDDGKQMEELTSYWMLSLCMVEADGAKVFADTQDCYTHLDLDSGAGVTKLVKKASEVLGLDVEAALKNLQETQTDSSSTV